MAFKTQKNQDKQTYIKMDTKAQANKEDIQVSEIVHHIIACKFHNLTSILGTHMVEGKNQFPKAVLKPSHACYVIGTRAHTDIHMQ